MKVREILHSGDFLDYDGNTIRVKFEHYKDIHLNINTTELVTPANGGEYIIEVWVNDNSKEYNYTTFVPGADEFISMNWISLSVIFKEDYINDEGYTVTKYKLTVKAKTGSTTRKGTAEIAVSGYSDVSTYPEFTKTIKITQ